MIAPSNNTLDQRLSCHSQELRNLREELAASEHLVREAQRLKQYVSNAEILKEKLHAEQQRAQRAEAALADTNEAKADVAALQAQLAHWQDFYKVQPLLSTQSRAVHPSMHGALRSNACTNTRSPDYLTQCCPAACAGCSGRPEARGPAAPAATAAARQPPAERAAGAGHRSSRQPARWALLLLLRH